MEPVLHQGTNKQNTSTTKLKRKEIKGHTSQTCNSLSAKLGFEQRVIIIQYYTVSEVQSASNVI